MLTFSRSESILLLLGDLLIFFVSLWVSLAARYLAIPSRELFDIHVVPFVVLSVVWAVVFFIAGLYDRHTDVVRQRLLSTLLHSQVANSALAVIFFFLLPIFGIAPKLLLLIYIVISTALLILWRVVIFERLTPSVRERAIILGGGGEVEELTREINATGRYGFEIVRMVRPEDYGNPETFEGRLASVIEEEAISIVIAHERDERLVPYLPFLFELTFARESVRFIELAHLYEYIFARVPLSLLRHDWFMTYASRSPHVMYDSLKRAIDIVAGVGMVCVFALLLPLVACAIKLEDRGSIFIAQMRKGQGNRVIRVLKFRTMRDNEHGVWIGESKNQVTRVGKVLRKTSLDELPQILNILKGEMSLIGPRNDIVGLAERLEAEIPFYAIRTMIKPGITGWAQTHQQYTPGNISPQSVEETRMRLAYDIYYIRHRSLLLDINIALRTLKTLLSRFGVGRSHLPKVARVIGDVTQRSQ